MGLTLDAIFSGLIDGFQLHLSSHAAFFLDFLRHFEALVSLGHNLNFMTPGF
jgi:hypothetical protein